MKRIISISVIIFMSLFIACELKDTDKSDYDYTREYLNNRCETDGQINYYPSGQCMRCDFGYWREFECSDFPGCNK